MKTHTPWLLAAASTFILAAAAQAQTGETAPRGATAHSPTKNVVSATGDTGTILRKPLRWSSKIPYNKTYGELSEKQRADFHAMYATLAAGDEPPFPAEGMKSMFYKIKNAQRLRQAHGEIKMKVTVGPDGTATKVEDFSTTMDGEMTSFIQSLLLLTKYKPAVCGGKPCEMQFPFDLKLL